MQALPAGTTCQQGLSEGLWAGESRRGVDPQEVRKDRKNRARKRRFTKVYQVHNGDRLGE